MTPPQEAPGASHQGTATSPPSPDGGSRSRRTGCPQGTSPNPSQTGAKPPGITGGGSPNCPTGRTGTVRGGSYLEGAAQKRHRSRRRAGRAVPGVLGTVAGVGMARSGVPRCRWGGRAAAPCPAQRGGSAVARRSRIGSGHPARGRSGMRLGRTRRWPRDDGGGRAEGREGDRGSQAERRSVSKCLLWPLYLIPSLFT